MISLSLSEIAHILFAKLSPESAGHLTVDRLCTDSRNVPPGSLFLALKGERFDAHGFLPQVSAAGAAAAIIDQPDKALHLAIPCLVVADTRKALGQLAAHVRSKLACRVIAIGGSNGKTTTKHLVGSVLAAAFKGTQSPKSFNNDIGVPTAILDSAPNDDYLLLELGTNHPGELAPLSTMARPDIAVITSIGAEHLEGFGDLTGVRREEATLVDGLNPHGILILNGDDTPLREMLHPLGHKTITFGFAADNDLRVEAIFSTLAETRFRISGVQEEFRLPLPGRHNACNALAAIVIGREFGMTDSAIRHALAHCTRPEMRMQVVHLGPITILNDAYNANPSSMRAALETIALATLPGRRVAVLGEMRELGTSALIMHQEIGRLAHDANLDLLICVSGAMRETAQAAVAAGMKANTVHYCDTSAQAAELLPALLQNNDTLLLKGSRTIKLELVADAVTQSLLAAQSVACS